MKEETLQERLRIRASIRRNAKGRKSVEEGKTDRLADLLDEAAQALDDLEAEVRFLMTCDKCDGPGGVKTFSNQVCMPINGRVQCIDWCIAHIVAALNAGGVETVASCCGHGTQQGRIDLRDGRVLYISGERRDETGSLCSDSIL